MTEIISVDTANSIMNPTWEVLQQKLVELGGHCVANKLLGFDGKLIRFYQRTCGFGMALPDYAEINAQQTAQIIKLADQYTVLEVSCDSFSGAALP